MHPTTRSAGGAVSPPRFRHVMAAVGGQIIVFGGHDGQLLNDTWAFRDGAWHRCTRRRARRAGSWGRGVRWQLTGRLRREGADSTLDDT
ncbi:Kelch repeat-containing protein [Pseudonocardia lacus]|uniref:Kelch repeat-containing protein n=1 Tax=Pseudonocardia lacus TaxID=2835865 RepID=UPI001BDC562C|nr:kelch repeat-containing protein [Pseudonocardia lacus]